MRVKNSRDDRLDDSRGEDSRNADGLASLVMDGARPYRDEFDFEALPKIDLGPDWHLFWATTTNTQDSPYKRIRMGYVFVTPDEVPDFKHLRIKAGEFEGCVSVNEMILMKIPMERYKGMMLELHHHKPNDEAERLREAVKLTQTTSRGRNTSSEIESDDEGYRELTIKRRPPPSFE